MASIWLTCLFVWNQNSMISSVLSLTMTSGIFTSSQKNMNLLHTWFFREEKAQAMINRHTQNFKLSLPVCIGRDPGLWDAWKWMVKFRWANHSLLLMTTSRPDYLLSLLVVIVVHRSMTSCYFLISNSDRRDNYFQSIWCSNWSSNQS